MMKSCLNYDMFETWRSIIRPGGDAFASSNTVRIDLSGCMNAIISCYEQRIPRRPLEIYGSAEDTKKKLETKNTPSSCNFPLLPAISMLQFSFIHIRELRYMVKFAELKGSRQLPFEDFVARLPSGSLNLWCSAVALHDSMKGATAAWVA